MKSSHTICLLGLDKQSNKLGVDRPTLLDLHKEYVSGRYRPYYYSVIAYLYELKHTGTS